MYLLFLDESGFSDPNHPAQYEEADFFVIGGVIVKEQNYQNVLDKFKGFKQANLPKEVADKPVHARDLNQVGLAGKDNQYVNVLSPENAKELLKRTYDFISTLPIEVIAITIDNVVFREKYTSRENSYLMSYKFLIEKFQKIISKRNGTDSHGIVTIATSSMATKLAKHHEFLIKNGTEYVQFKTIFPKLNIQNQAECIFLEIADLIAYAYNRSYHDYLCEHLGKKTSNESYLMQISSLAKDITIGKIIIGDKIRTKIFPTARFLKSKK